jgi:hypothetical protein
MRAAWRFERWPCVGQSTSDARAARIGTSPSAALLLARVPVERIGGDHRCKDLEEHRRSLLV